MKRIKKLAVVVLAVAMMAFCMVGCGSVQKDVDTDWTLDKVNGQALADWAAANGVEMGNATMNMSVKDGKATVTNYASTVTYDVDYKSNGFEIKQDGNILFSVTYNKDAQTLSYKININGTDFDYELKKGTSEIGAASQGGEEGAAEGGEGAAEGGEEAPAEGGEETPAVGEEAPAEE